MNIQTQRGFTRAVTPISRDLTGFAMRLTADPDDASDLVQETLARAWRYREAYEPDCLRAWLMTIMRREWCRECSRRATRARNVARLDQPLSDVPDYDGALDMPAVDAVLEQLDPKFRHVIHAVEIRGLSYRETSDALDLKMGTVMSRLHRGRKQLRGMAAR